MSLKIIAQLRFGKSVSLVVSLLVDMKIFLLQLDTTCLQPALSLSTAGLEITTALVCALNSIRHFLSPNFEFDKFHKMFVLESSNIAKQLWKTFVGL